VVLSHWALPNGKAQEVETRRHLLLMQGVADAGFAWFQFQSHAFEPLLDDDLTLANDPEIPMADDKIVRIADNRWSPFDNPAVDPLGLREGIPDDFLQAMQSYVCQQGG
jgi:hypothetical protein